MARINVFSVTFKVEQIVKLLCEDTDCEHNLASKPAMAGLQSETYLHPAGRLL